jgi:hypothetical protein
MTDQRELIMVRLAEVVNVTGVKTVSRNRVDFDETQLPAVGVLEGDEEVAENTLGRSARASGRPYIVTATPQVFIRVGGTSENIGSDLNTLRASVIKALLSDADLTGMSMDDGGMQYAGMQSMLHAARSMIGATAMVFVIKYLLYPDRL